MQYWAGYRTVTATGPDEDADGKSEFPNRGEKVFKVSHSEFFAESTEVCLISSLPRGYMARCLFSDKMHVVEGLLSV